MNSFVPPDVASDAPRGHAMPFGAQIETNGVRFRLFAPAQRRVTLVLEETRAFSMHRTLDGWHQCVVPAAGAGTRYRFQLEDGLMVPDPASRYQPEDAHGPSEVIDPARYTWRDTDWHGRPWHEAIIYELHIGAFTSEGTFRAATERLDDLVELGVTAVEIMPVADFPGGRNWGYDGVLFYAPDSSYGRPEDLRAFVDAAHARGLMVILDVVYNHFGPDGNYLHAYAPCFFTERHRTPWGAGLNFDGPNSAVVRDFMIHNALYWLQEFHMDGLRLDAVHAIMDDSADRFLNELERRVRAACRGRHVHLIVENEANEAHLLEGDPSTRFTAQWNDDVHHAVHAAITGEAEGYYADYAGDTERLGRALAEGFAFQGEHMPYRGTERGEPSAHLASIAFVAFLQNHDQIGNRAFGERITALAPREAVRAAAALYLLGPQIPMLFMGEEWAAAQPFLFFCGFEGDLAEAVRAGRRAEFARFPAFRDPDMRERIPDPVAQSTFLASKLEWSDRDLAEHLEWLDWYRHVIAVRREHVWPLLPLLTGRLSATRVVGRAAVEVAWTLEDGRRLCVAANLAAVAQDGFRPPEGTVLWTEGAFEDGRAAPWSVRWCVAGA
ncbi:malto-oligosyltrehalose trehalohydrolase [Roseixanthobacter liquoris]|uniref:malto-oligosyltrehalose trehalohydrolase n=1 Tax=Roseixanthobacter liquoris TaxID=3119921 RepID=UPI00372D22EE